MAGGRSQRIPEVMEKTEVNCVWGILSMLQSCQGGGLAGPKLISNGRPDGRHVIAGHPRKLDQITSFDEECRKIQNVDETRIGSNGRARSAKEVIAKGQQQVKMDSAHVDDLAKTRRKARKNREKARHQSSPSQLHNADKLVPHQPSASAEISLNRLTLAALLQAVSARNRLEDGSLSECLHRGSRLGKQNQADRNHLQQVRPSGKAFVDRMYIDRDSSSKEHGTRAESKSLSGALEVLDSNKDRLMDLLPEPDSLLSRGSKNFRPSTTGRDTIKSLLDAKLAEYKRENGRTSGKPGSAVAIQKGKRNKQLRQKIEYPRSKSTKTSSAIQPTDKILALEPTQSAKNFEYVSCYCSTVQSQRTLGRLISDAKLASLTFRGTKKKLKYAFGSGKEEGQCSMNRASDGLDRSGSTRVVGDDCAHCGVDDGNSFNSLANVNIDGKLRKKQEVGCATENIGKKAEFDEAKRRLSERLRKLSKVEAVKIDKTTRTLRRILASPEHDFCPLSPRRESQCFSSSAQVPNARERACVSPNRCYDCNKYDDSKKSSLIPSPDAALETKASAVKKSNGETLVLETNGIQEPEPSNSDVSRETNTKDVTTAMHMADAAELHKDDDSVVNSLLDSLSENDALTSTADDFQSTSSSSVCHLDSVDNAKYQEEHQSPVSVLEPFFIEDANSPQSMTLRTARKTLQPLHLDFEEQPSNLISHDPSISSSSCSDDREYISEYVYSVLQASCLDWDQLSKIRSPLDELLHETVFNEVEFLLTDCCVDPKLLFDHINEVLVEIHRSNFCSCPFPAPIEPRSMTVPLAQLVLDEIMPQADFYLLPRTEKRTLDQLTSKDVGKSRWWLDVRLDTEQIVADLSEDFLEECVLDMILELYT